jgi:hypothetical protein
MRRTLLCSLAGAGTGFLVGVAVVLVVAAALARGQGSDTAPVAMFVGIFLAGAGAIAGAIVGGVADLKEFFRTKDQAPRE